MQYKNLKYFRGHVMMRWNIKKTSVAYINTYIHKHMYTYTHTVSFNLHMRSVKTASDFLFVGSLSNTRTLFAMISFNYENTGLKGNKVNFIWPVNKKNQCTADINHACWLKSFWSFESVTEQTLKQHCWHQRNCGLRKRKLIPKLHLLLQLNDKAISYCTSWVCQLERRLIVIPGA